MVVGIKTNEVKTSKIFFFAQDKPGTSFLNNTIHVYAFHIDVETPLSYHHHHHHHHHRTYC